MKRSEKILNLIPVLAVILTGVLSRLIPHPPNFTPVGGLALFAGATVAGPAAFLLPLAVMLIADLVLGFHSTLLYVYGSFLLIVLLGRLLRNKKGIARLTGSSLAASLLFFLITNFGAWLTWDFYPKTPSGLLASYTAALPFFRNTILGDLFYSVTFFYGYRLLAHFLKKAYIMAFGSR